MKRIPISLTTVLATMLTMLAVLSTARAQESSAVEDEDEAFLNQPAAPEAQAEAQQAEAQQAEPQAGEETESPEPEGEASEEGEEERKLDHAKQGFVSVLAGVGWYLVAPYSKNNPGKMCEVTDDLTDEGEPEGEPVCTGRSVWHLDMLGGYGVLPGFEVFAIFRIGLETKPPGMNQPNTRQIGAGIKVYSPSEGLFKIGFGIAPLFDFSDHGSADIGYDFIIHVPIQAHFDIIPWFGAFLQISPNISFISEFRLEFTGGIGVEGKFP